MASFTPFVSSDPFSMSTFNTKLGGAFDSVDKNVSDVATMAKQALEAAQAAGMKKTLVWINPNPSTEYIPPQTIEWERGPDTKFIVIETKYGTTLISPEQTSFFMMEYNIVPGNTTQNMQFWVRYGNVETNGLSFATQFGKCYKGTISSGGSTSVSLENNSCVPLRVYELK